MVAGFEGSLKVQTDVRDRYDLLAKLGSGGMADVYLGIQRGAEGFEQLVVIKRIKEARLSEKDDSLRMFVREARTVALLSHPHIVKVFDLCRMGDTLAIVMEYVDGENLEYMARALAKARGRLPLGIVCRMMTQACEALHYAHTATTPEGRDMKLVHRDVGPHNLMIDSSGYLKVIDFGIAKTTVQMDLTSPGIIKGKLSYLAPDLFKFPDVDHRIDIYALGLVFWRLLTLRVPFDFKPDITVAELIRRVSTEELPRPSELVPELPSRVDDIVAKATARDREQRYGSCEELAAELRRFSDKHGGLAAASDVKKWYTRVFRARIEKRREFEKRVLDKARELAQDKERSSPRVGDSTSRLIADATAGDSPSPAGLSGSGSTTPSVQLSATWPPVPPPGTGAVPRRRGKLWLLLAALLLAGGAGAVVVGVWLPARQEKRPAETVAAVKDNLRVVAEPAGAEVFIDGRSLGRAAADGLVATISPDREHLIEVKREGYVPYQLRATGQRQGRLEVVARLVKQVSAKPKATPVTAATEPPAPRRQPDKPAGRRTGRRPPRRREPPRVARVESTPSRPATTSDSGDKAATSAKPPAPQPRPEVPPVTPPVVPPVSKPVVTQPASATTSDAGKRVAAVEPQPPPPPRREVPEVKLLSGSGNWSGEQALEKGCNSCHGRGRAKAFSPDDKTKRQWRFFFRRNRHDRHAELRKLFSRGELDRVLQEILSRMTRREKTGIAGER